VADLATGRDLAVPTDHASAPKCREPQEPNETHHVLRSRAEQFMCRGVRAMHPSCTQRQYAYRLQRFHAECRTRSDLWTEKRQHGFADSIERACASSSRAAARLPIDRQWFGEVVGRLLRTARLEAEPSEIDVGGGVARIGAKRRV